MAHNGYRNFETWIVVNFLTNTFEEYDFLTGAAEDAFNASLMGAFIEDYIDQIERPAGLFGEFVGNALSEVDWSEVGEAFKPDEGWMEDREFVAPVGPISSRAFTMLGVLIPAGWIDCNVTQGGLEWYEIPELESAGLVERASGYMDRGCAWVTVVPTQAGRDLLAFYQSK